MGQEVKLNILFQLPDITYMIYQDKRKLKPHVDANHPVYPTLLPNHAMTKESLTVSSTPPITHYSFFPFFPFPNPFKLHRLTLNT